MNSDAVPMSKSLLEKPLSLLTEDDISQITREECRRFLKNRGMRRPSWNKSQAIQQVISLKALLENRTDPESLSAATMISRKPQSCSSSPISLPSPSSAPLREKDPSPYRRKDPIPAPFTAGDFLWLHPAARKSQLSQQIQFPYPKDFAFEPMGQLTIFYGGKVNVYDGVPSAKAQEIMLLAATPDTAVTPVSSGLPPFISAYTGPVWARPSTRARCYINTPEGKLQRSFKDSLEERRASREPFLECPTSRTASLKRYLEKRKGRYLSQKFCGPGQNELSSRSNSSSSMQPRPPCPPLSRCNSIETNKLGSSVDLNDDGSGGT